jgi:cellulose synthase/poly-beta-1,6-N-acetylglucosamine synthase-like glycosyltransferase
MSIELFAFWLPLVLLVYTYLGYPLLLWIWSGLRPKQADDGEYMPVVTLLVVAHNEAGRIQERLENLLALDYPRDRIEIILASDGSTDDTVARAGAYRQAGVVVMPFLSRRGKSAVLNDLIPKARGEIVVLADSRQRFEPGVLKALIAHFGNPSVGAVSGELILTGCSEGPAVKEGVGFYWRYEKFIRRMESRVDSTVGVTGAIYAIRRDLFRPISDETILDDVLIPMKIAQQGFRVLFEPDARAYDPAATTAAVEFTRKVRTIAGNFQLFAREPWLLNPFRNRLWLQTISHKGCRLLCPLALGMVFVTNLFLLAQPMYRWILGAQCTFYAASFGGHCLRNHTKRFSFLNVPYAFCLLNWATVVACFRFVMRQQTVTWEKARREEIPLESGEYSQMNQLNRQA